MSKSKTSAPGMCERVMHYFMKPLILELEYVVFKIVTMKRTYRKYGTGDIESMLKRADIIRSRIRVLESRT